MSGDILKNELHRIEATVPLTVLSINSRINLVSTSLVLLSYNQY